MTRGWWLALVLSAGCQCGGPSTQDGGSSGGGAGGGSGGASGGGTGGGAAGDAGTLPLSVFCATYPSRACAVKLGCGLYSDAGLATCLANEADFYAELCRRADAGYLDYSPAAAARCIAELEGAPRACINAWFGCGLVPFGLDIFRERPNGCGVASCTAGQFCDRDCAGPACGPLLGQGQPCRGGDCAAGLLCGTFDGGPLRCEPGIPVDGACEFDGCGSGLYCDLVQRRCAVFVDAGLACTTSGQCADGVCRPTDGVCGALPLGQRCGHAFDCGRQRACRDLALAADGGLLDAGTCSAQLPLGASCAIHWGLYNSGPCRHDLGESCLDGVCTSLEAFTQPAGYECPVRPYGWTSNRYLGFAVCRRGLTCQPDATAHPPRTGRCAPALPLGAPCFDQLECETGDCIAGDGGRFCTRRRLDGAPCQPGTCALDRTCVERDAGVSTCGPLRMAGESCGYADCVRGTTCDFGLGQCVALGQGGAACTMDNQCASGSCDAGAACDPVPVCRF